MQTKISQLRAAIANQDREGTIRIAARFPRLGAIRNDVLDARMAYTNPRFAQQIGKDPETLKQAGYAAVVSAYTSKP